MSEPALDDSDGPLPAGGFSSWLAQIQAAINGDGESVVPCGTCTACCTSSQFVHIGPDETDTLSHIPAELLFPAPRLPRGHVLLGYDERGHCPMLVDNRCSIYEHRPKTCRTYDCRIFPATGLAIDDDEKVLIEERAQRWRFDFASQADCDQRDAVRGAASFVTDHPELLADLAPATETQKAVLAIELRDLFLQGEPDTDLIRAAVVRLRGTAQEQHR